MIDYFALALSHALLLIMLLRLMTRPDLDREDELGPEDEDVPAKEPDSRRKARRARRSAERGDA